MKYQGVKGTMDFLPETAECAYDLEVKARNILNLYGYRELRLPVLENINVFLRGLGDTTDIVQKQLFRIADKEDICLRPEGTAQLVRSCVQNNLFEANERVKKLFYVGAMFRGERPQKGRLRQFHQIGVEAMGVRSPVLDAEVIKLGYDILCSFGLENGKHFSLEINTLGTLDDKHAFESYLKDTLESAKPDLCDLCNDRYDKNILRVLDCKNPSCKEIVSNLDLDRSYLSDESKKYYAEVLRRLDDFGITVYNDDPLLVRGLDYYTHTVFEFTTDLLGAQAAIGAGGRYDNLVKELGGKEVPCCGFGLGLERIMLMLEDDYKELSPIRVFVAYAGEENFDAAYDCVMMLRDEGISADLDFTKPSLKSQLKYSQKVNAEFVVILGEDEIKNNVYMLRDMQNSQQHTVDFDGLIDKLTY